MSDEPLDDMVLGERIFQVDKKAWITFEPHKCLTFLVGETEETAEEVAMIEPSMLSAIYGAYRQMVKEMREGVADER